MRGSAESRRSGLMRVVVAGLLALPCGFVWWLGGRYDPGGWIVRHWVKPDGLTDAGEVLLFGFGADFLVCMGAWYVMLGAVKHFRKLASSSRSNGA